MDFKDYYATLGVARDAKADEVKRAYRKLARKYHPDVSKEPDAEARFKEVAEAHEALIDPERRAAYDEMLLRHERGQPFDPHAGGGGFEYSGRGAEGMDSAAFSEFFESLFGRAGAAEHGRRGAGGPAPGADHHAQVVIDLQDAYRGARRTISLRMPVIDDSGRARFHERQIEVGIPPGVRAGQHLRLAGQGGAGHEGAAAGDLYLEVQFRPHPVFRVDGRDVYLDLPVAPWEAALGADVMTPTPGGVVQLTVPAGSGAGRKLRLKGQGLPGKTPGDLYAVLTIALPPCSTPGEQAAFAALALAFPDFNPRATLEA